MVVELIILASIFLLIATYLSNVYIANRFESPTKYRLMICSLKSMIFLVILLRMFICPQINSLRSIRNIKNFCYIQKSLCFILLTTVNIIKSGMS